MFSANINLIGYLFACKCLYLCVYYIYPMGYPQMYDVSIGENTHENVSILLQHLIWLYHSECVFGCCLFFGVLCACVAIILTPSSRQQTKHAMRQAIHQRLFIFVQFTHSLTPIIIRSRGKVWWIKTRIVFEVRTLHIHTCVRISEATFTQDEDEYLILYYLNNNNNNIERI